MHELKIMISKLFDEDCWGIAFCSPAGAISIRCEPCEVTAPFYGKVFTTEDIQQMIDFLKATLEEKGRDDKEP